MPEQLTVQLLSYETDSSLSRSLLSLGVSSQEETHEEHRLNNTNSRSSTQQQQQQQQEIATESGLINSSQIINSSANNSVVLRPSLDSGIKNNTNRFSCNELECLKERFVDFIKLDPTNASCSATSNSAMNTSFMKSSDGGLMTKPFPKSKSMQIYQDRNSLLSEMDYQTFAQCKSGQNGKQQQQQQNSQIISKNLNGARYLSRLSVVSSEYSSAESSVSSSSSTTSSTNRPEPPARTVSIRNSQCIYSSSASSSASSTSSSSISPTLSNNEENHDQTYARLPTAAEIQRANVKEDTASIRSGSIYGTSSYRGHGYIPSSQSSFTINNNFNNSSNNNIVRSSRSVFSIYEEEDEVAHLNTSDQSPNTPTGKGVKPFYKLELLTDAEMRRIESMYRSMGCIVSVSPCTCDLFTTTSEHIANRLNDCWNLEISSVVPVWLFDTGLNPKRKKQLRLLFVDKCTAFPIGATQQTTTSVLNSFSKPILINESNLPKNPDNDKSITFTLNNRQIVCLVQFTCFTSCQDFFKFFTNLLCNPNYPKLFNQTESVDLKTENSRFSFMKSSRNHSQSLLSLTRLNQSAPKPLSQKKSNRHSEFIANTVHFTPDSLSNGSRMKSSQTWDSLKHLDSGRNEPKKERVRVTGITKSCISNPCAFQHINSIKDGDQRLKMFVDFKSK